MAALQLFAWIAKADTEFLTEAPSATITPADAGKSKDPVFKCERVKRGPNVNPVKVPGSKTIWTKGPIKGIDNAGELLADNKKLYRCKSMLMDNESARMKSFSVEE